VKGVSWLYNFLFDGDHCVSQAAHSFVLTSKALLVMARFALSERTKKNSSLSMNTTTGKTTGTCVLCNL